MTSTLFRRSSAWLAGVVLALAAAAACDLNPQPLPPGLTPGTNTHGGEDASAGDSGATFAGDDGGTGGADDASTDGAVAAPPDGGAEAGPGDSGVDGETDAPADSPSDGPADAPDDTMMEEGG
ncbi:MAG TPA: hypothetical protein VIF09_08990 [Polyangiaceae bacterium]|jgi:hypothetical protein